MVRIRRGGDKLSIKLQNDFGASSLTQSVQKIFCFTILNHSFFAIARTGLVQLFERQKASELTLAYKLVREWKNSTASRKDRIVTIGSFRNQYMYTCSNEGKLVIRDLINDDADESVKVYLLEGPISCVAVAATTCTTRVLIGAGGRSNDLKLYDLDFGAALPSNASRLFSVEIPGASINSMVRFANEIAEMPPLRRTLYQYFSTLSDWKRLTPVFTMSPGPELVRAPSVVNWILSVCFAEHAGHRIVFAGTQYGGLVVYGAERPFSHKNERQSFQLSQFPISMLHVFSHGRYVVYVDAMSKVGVIDVASMAVVNFYDYLRLGPSMACRVCTAPTPAGKVPRHSTVARFLPFYVLATTIDGNIVIYRLHDTNEREIKLFMNQAGVIPDLEILEADSYSALEAVFEPMSGRCGPRKRRKDGRLQSDTIS